MYKKDFPIFAHNPKLIYLDSASTTQKPLSVIEGVNSFLMHDYANIHRGMYDLSSRSEYIYDQSKLKVAQVLGCSSSEIIYGYNATHLSNVISQALFASHFFSPGDKILLGIWDHHATIVPWQLLADFHGLEIDFITLDEHDAIDWNHFQKIYTDNVRVVACSLVSNVTGSVFDLASLGAYLRDDTFFVIDGSQAIPHFSVQVEELGCDAFFFTGHKTLAYTGIGAMYLKKHRIRSLATLLGGGGTVEQVTEEGCMLVRTSSKFEAGTPNIIGAVSLLKAFEYIDSIGGYPTLLEYEHSLIEYILHKFTTVSDKVTLLGKHSVHDRVGVFSFVIKGQNSIDINEKLSDHDIAMRCGGHCAHPLIALYGHNGVCRISTYIYTTRQDIDAFFDALTALI